MSEIFNAESEVVYSILYISIEKNPEMNELIPARNLSKFEHITLPNKKFIVFLNVGVFLKPDLLYGPKIATWSLITESCQTIANITSSDLRWAEIPRKYVYFFYQTNFDHLECSDRSETFINRKSIIFYIETMSRFFCWKLFFHKKIFVWKKHFFDKKVKDFPV